LLATRFEELDWSDAALFEALLGPLAQAIVVDNPQAAADVLTKLDERPETLWLLSGAAPLPLDEHGRPLGDSLGRDALVPTIRDGA